MPTAMRADTCCHCQMLHLSTLVTEVVEYSCNLAPDLMGEYVEGVSTGMDTYSIKQPLGVCSRMVSHVACLIVIHISGIPATCSILAEPSVG